MKNRERLPDRRRSDTFEFDHRYPDGSSFTYIATLGHYVDGRIGEVFLQATKTGTTIDINTRDSAIALSLALQFGCPLDVIAPTFLRSAEGRPEGPLGTLVDILVGRRSSEEVA